MTTTDGKKAWVTLATNDSYAIGALVLAHSLCEVQTRFPTAILVSEQVSDAMRSQLREVFAEVHDVNILDSNDSAHLALLARPELGVTFTKLHCWALTHLEKAVFLDADTLVVQNCDELFDREELSAAPDAGWPDCFNSGVFVFKPSLETYNALLEYAVSHGSFDGGDQGLLNAYFSDWATKDIGKHLPFVYNMTATSSYSYLPAHKRYGTDVRIAHLIGYPKPWQVPSISAYAAGPGAPSEYVQRWWSLFESHVRPILNSQMEGTQLATCPLMAQPEVIPEPESEGQASESEVPEVEENPTVSHFHDERSPWYGDYRQTGIAITYPEPPTSPHRQYTEISPRPTTQAPDQQAQTSALESDPSFNELMTSDVGTPEVEEQPIEEPNAVAEDQPCSSQHGVAAEPERGIAAMMGNLDLNPAEESGAEAAVRPDELLEEDRQRHREAWERGEIDYNGRDSFANILEKMKETINRAKSNPVV